MKRLGTLWLLSLLAFVSCKEHLEKSASKDNLDTVIHTLLKEGMSDSYDAISGMSVSVIAPELDFKHSTCAGYDSKTKKDTLANDQPFRIASVTKTFVACAILRLHEMDSISIYDPLSKYISLEHQNILKQDTYDLDKIQLIHCLNHTSGLFDYAMGSRAYIEEIKQEKNKRYTRTSQLQAAVKFGDKLDVPGDQYSYSDTGYILLGEIIEQFYQGDLALGLRSLLKFDELGLRSTWLETLEDHPRDSVAKVHRYMGRDDFSDWDASIDLYGGGGLVSTTQDLATFVHALFNHHIFDKKETLELLKTKPDYAADYDFENDNRFKDYRLGMWEIQLFGKDTYIHNGLWGIMMIHQPETNTSLAINFTNGRNQRTVKRIFLALLNVRENNN